MTTYRDVHYEFFPSGEEIAITPGFTFSLNDPDMVKHDVDLENQNAEEEGVFLSGDALEEARKKKKEEEERRKAEGILQGLTLQKKVLWMENQKKLLW